MDRETVDKAERWVELAHVNSKPHYLSKTSVKEVVEHLRQRMVSICRLHRGGVGRDEELVFTEDYVVHVFTICNLVRPSPPSVRFFPEDDVRLNSIFSRRIECSLARCPGGPRFTFYRSDLESGWWFELLHSSSIFFSDEAFLDDRHWECLLTEARRTIADQEFAPRMSELERQERAELARLLTKYPDVIPSYGPKA